MVFIPIIDPITVQVITTMGIIGIPIIMVLLTPGQKGEEGQFHHVPIKLLQMDKLTGGQQQFLQPLFVITMSVEQEIQRLVLKQNHRIF